MSRKEGGLLNQSWRVNEPERKRTFGSIIMSMNQREKGEFWKAIFGARIEELFFEARHFKDCYQGDYGARIEERRLCSRLKLH